MPEPMKLDRKRHYGVVYGDPNVGFVQDERSFRPDGTLFEPAVPIAPLAVQAKPPDGDKEVDPVRSARMKQAWEARRFKRTSEAEPKG